MITKNLVIKLIRPLFFIVFILSGKFINAQPGSEYNNPVIHADYSDPDVTRVGKDYYMVASSFNHVPGLPLLHSTDLVNWKLEGYALQRLIPEEHFSSVQHGCGVWAPSIRFHDNEFYIYYPDPDFGIYLVKAKDIKGPWSAPVMVLAGKGLIDPCPLWDNDGKVFLVHAYAGSRAGIKSVLVVREMNPEGTKVISPAQIVYDGHIEDPTIEGPKLYKRNGFYYIFAPAGGVTNGWQTVLRSRSVYGPYERKIVMEQGKTDINGPHQGAWVQTENGENWFLHFQDKGVYGRIVHLQPMVWKNNWPVIGEDPDGNGKGNPVSVFKKPHGSISKGEDQPWIDEFLVPSLRLQWQWQANPATNWYSLGHKILRLNAVLHEDSLHNLYNAPNLLMQKFPAKIFTVNCQLMVDSLRDGESTGLIVFGYDYAWIGVQRKAGHLNIVYSECEDASKGKPESVISLKSVREGQTIYLQVKVGEEAACTFGYSFDGVQFNQVGILFSAKQGRWVGAKTGIFATGNRSDHGMGFSEFMRVEVRD